MPHTNQNLLGWKAMEITKLVQRINSVQQTLPKEKVEKEYGDLFEGIGCLEEVHKIKVKEGAHPIACPPRRVPEALIEKVHEELQLLSECGVIRKLGPNEPTE